MLNPFKQIKLAIIVDDQDSLAELVANTGARVEFEHIGLARRLNRQQILSILLGGMYRKRS